MKKLWISFVAVIVISFSVLGWVGSRIYQTQPPIPLAGIVATDGKVMIPAGSIERGQNIWQSIGGMELGSFWGHGSYVAPDWTADWLHRESVFLLNAWAKKDFSKAYEALPTEQQAQLQSRLQTLMRHNQFDPVSGTIVVDPLRVMAF